MELSQLLRLGQIIATLGSVALNVYLFLKARNNSERKAALALVEKLKEERRLGDAALHKRVDAVHGDISARDGDSMKRDHYLHRRVSIIETQIAHLPTQADLTSIRQQLSSLNANVAALGERSQSNNEMLHSIQNHLMGTDS
jgi:hypothetical protein